MVHHIRQFFRQANETVFVLFGEGSWRLRHHEQVILNAGINNCEPEAQRLLQQQLLRGFFIEKTNSKINVLRFRDPLEEVRLSAPEFQDMWFRVALLVNGKREISNVNIYRGLIFSFETRSPKKVYRRADLKVLSVKIDDGAKSLTKAIDRAEHGSS
ncbi:MAG: hypothetical protein OXC60_11320 [Litoreibacter sp.]|nr:hypothetical protein [Litoreibacter sp.]